MLYLRLAVALVKPLLLAIIAGSVLMLLGVDVLDLAWSVVSSTIGAVLDWLAGLLVDRLTFW
jgi:hypothetical protein